MVYAMTFCDCFIGHESPALPPRYPPPPTLTLTLIRILTLTLALTLVLGRI